MNRENPKNIAPVIGGSNYPNRGSPKVYTDPLPDFSRYPVYYKEWESKYGAKIIQTVYNCYLSRPETSGNIV